MPGSLVEISVDGRSFKAAADADGSTKLGGMSSEFSPNGDGQTGRNILTRTGWGLSGVDLAFDDENADLEFLQGVQDSGRFIPVKAVYADGTIRSGRGNVTGTIEVSSMSGTASVAFEGPGKFALQ